MKIGRKLTPAHYQKLLALQKGRCAICDALPVGRRLAVDHCHREDFVRGLLCSRCNLGLVFMEEPNLRDRAAKYLERARKFVSARYEHKLVALDVPDFLEMDLPKEDWRSCPEPHRQEMLLAYEIEKMFHVKKMRPNQIAKNLGISRGRVKRLIREEFRSDRPVYYKSTEVAWPYGAAD